MKSESGRSLIEVIGVLALTAIMTAGAIKVYSSVRHNQNHTIASAELREIVKSTRLLFDMRGDYNGVSVEYLEKAGALKSGKAPIGESWSVEPFDDGKSFSVNLFNLSHSDCDFFAVSVPQWASDMIVNGQHFDTMVNCFSGETNNISFIVE